MSALMSHLDQGLTQTAAGLASILKLHQDWDNIDSNNN